MAPTLSASLAAYAEDLRARWGVSALSVSLVDGQSQAFGNPTSGPMTPDTVCLIASNTKLFTAVAIGILVDQGKLSFDSKIKDLIPNFTVENQHTTDYVTVADAMSHSSGCISGNINFALRYSDTHKDLLDNICTTRCAKELRQAFAYDNRWFGVMAYIIEQLSGQTYSDFVKVHILVPLGMSSSTLNSKEAEAKAATPTITLDDAETTKDLPFFYTRLKPGNSSEGAGGLFSTSSDMAKWVKYLMKTANTTSPASDDDPKIISKETFKQIITPRVVSDMQLSFSGLKAGEAVSPEFSTPLYAMAVERHHLHGIDIACHIGCMPGYSSFTLWTPGRDFGIVIVANAVHRGNAVINLIALRAFEEHFEIAHSDWEKLLLEHEENWATGPHKMPTLDGYKGLAAVDPSELKGTYESKGCRSRLHVVGVQDVALPANVQHLRDHLLKQEIFGRPTAEISLMAIWDTEEGYLGDFFNLIHLEDNVFFGELYKLCPETNGQQGVLLPTSALWGPSSRFLFYALKGSNGKVMLEVKICWKGHVPQIAEGDGDFTFLKLDSF